MPRYIDAEQLKDYIKQYWVISGRMMISILDNIDIIPTADVHEVRHAHWRKTEYAWSICSNCLSIPKMYFPFNYCPWCGAKMDEKEENADVSADP